MITFPWLSDKAQFYFNFWPIRPKPLFRISTAVATTDIHFDCIPFQSYGIIVKRYILPFIAPNQWSFYNFWPLTACILLCPSRANWLWYYLVIFQRIQWPTHGQDGLGVIFETAISQQIRLSSIGNHHSSIKLLKDRWTLSGLTESIIYFGPGLANIPSCSLMICLLMT